MYQGFIDADEGGTLIFQLRTSAGAPVEPDSAPKFKIVGPSGIINGSSSFGSASSLESGTVTNATNTTPIQLTLTPVSSNPVAVGQSITVSGVNGNTGANGTFILSATNPPTLTGSVGNGAYTNGGVWKTTGLYKVTITSTQGMTPGQTYSCILTWLEGGVQRSLQASFTVR